MAVFTRLSGDKTGALVIGYSIKFAAGTPTAAKISPPWFVAQVTLYLFDHANKKEDKKSSSNTMLHICN